MTIIDAIISYYKRRIFIPVTTKDLVLDIGSGDRPHWRADVLLDKYISDKYSSQRSGSGKVVISKPIVNCDIEKMPFKDKVFDYVICSHVLEHVVNPDKAIREIVRVGKGGYIELPYAGLQKIRDFPTHLWYCSLNGKYLDFHAKNETYFDQDIDRFINQPSIRKIFNTAFFFGDDQCLVRLYWKNDIRCRIFGSVNQKLILKQNKEKRVFSILVFYLSNLLQFVLSLPLTGRRRRKPVKATEIFKTEYCQKIKDRYLLRKIY